MESKMDIVYILGSGSRWNNNEIRYSLRSLEWNFEYGKVFIIGEKPEWMTNVIHIQVDDSNEKKNGVKLLNARAKYTAAATDHRISKNFVLMNDDFFFLEQMETIPNYIRGTLEEMAERHPTKNGYYYHSMNDTRHRLSAMGITNPKDFEIHAPIIFNKENLITVMGMMGNDKPYLLRSCYGNLMNLETKKVIDFKAANIPEFAFQTHRSREFMSINDALVAHSEFRNWIERKYPKPSKFEMDGGAGAKILPGRALGVLKYYATKDFSYNKKFYSKGDILDRETVKQLRDTPRMRELWTLK